MSFSLESRHEDGRPQIETAQAYWRPFFFFIESEIKKVIFFLFCLDETLAIWMFWEFRNKHLE